MSSDKQSKLSLSQLVRVERMKGREPRMTVVLEVLDRILEGERDADALRLLAEHGLPAMMLDAHRAGVVEHSHWEIWKARMGSVEAEMVLASSAEWPNEIREWATVVTVSGL